MAGEIHFFPDAHPDAGLGHLVRCSSLAHAVQHMYTPIFWVTHPAWAQAVVPFEVQPLTNYQHQRAAWSVIDSYQNQPELFQRINGQSNHVMLIDDGLQPYRDADLILNPAAGPWVAQAYVNTGVPVLHGPAYALLRPPFLQPYPPMEEREAAAVVCFGGRDPRNLTQQVVHELCQIPEVRRIHAVLGPAAEDIAVVDPRVVMHRNLSAEDMAGWMGQVRWAVVPASGLAYEALSRGCQVVVGHYVNNQQGLFQGLVDEGYVISAGGFEPGQVQAALQRGLDQGWPTPLSHPWDGQSPQRLVAALQAAEQPLSIQPAGWSDSDLLLAWANDPVTRQASFHPGVIERAQHERWFSNRIDHPDYHILLGWNGNQPVGSFRVERHSEGWVCSVVIAPAARGQGWATTLIFKACHALRIAHGVEAVTAYIKAENTASIKAFTRAGFTFVRETEVQQSPSFEYRWS